MKVPCRKNALARPPRVYLCSRIFCDATKAAVPGCGRSARDRVLRRCETRFRGGGGARRRVVRLAAVGRRARGPAAVGTSLLAGHYDRGVPRQRLIGSAAGGGGTGGAGGNH